MLGLEGGDALLVVGGGGGGVNEWRGGEELGLELLVEG